MIFKMFVLYDSGVSAYMTPIFARNKGEALRSLSKSVNGASGSILADHPEQFVLYEIGEFNDETGSVVPHLVPDCICKAIELKQVTAQSVNS